VIQEALFVDPVTATNQATEAVPMPVDAAHWDQIWQSQKIHELQRRFLAGPATGNMKNL
jgi:hypothetical protein